MCCVRRSRLFDIGYGQKKASNFSSSGVEGTWRFSPHGAPEVFSHTIDSMGAGGQRQVGGIIGRPEKGGAIRGEEKDLHISNQGCCSDGADLRLVQMQGAHGSDARQSPLMGGDGVVHGGADRGGDGFFQVENHVFLGQIVEKRQIVGVRESSEKEQQRAAESKPDDRRGSLERKRNRFIEILLNCARKNFCRGDTGGPPEREKHPKIEKETMVSTDYFIISSSFLRKGDS